MSKDIGNPEARVFVGGISWKADEESLSGFFNSFGPVSECKIIMDKNTGKSKGYGFVTFQNAESAQRVKQSTNLTFLGKQMNVGDAVRKNENNFSNDTQDGKQANYSHGYPPGYSPYPFYPNQMMFQPQHHAAMMYMAANGIPLNYFGAPYFDPNFQFMPHPGNYQDHFQDDSQYDEQEQTEDHPHDQTREMLNKANFPPISDVYGKRPNGHPAPYMPMMHDGNHNYKQALNP